MPTTPRAIIISARFLKSVMFSIRILASSDKNPIVKMMPFAKPLMASFSWSVFSANATTIGTICCIS